MIKPKANCGYTLIEVLIVMLIITIVGGVTMLTISKNKNSQIKNAANQITSLFRFAEDQALLQPAVLGVTVQNNQIKFYEFTHDAKKNKDTWVETSNKLLASVALPSGTSVKLKNEDEKIETSSDKIKPQIIFSSSGETNSFTLLLGKNRNSPLYKISSANGSLQITKL